MAKSKRPLRIPFPERKPNIVIVSFYKSYTPESGAANVTFLLSKHLAGNKTLIQLNPGEKSLSLEENLDIVNEWGFPHNRMLKALGILIRLPFILNRIRALKAHIVIIEGAAWSCYNIFLYLGLKTALPRVKIIYHAHNVEYFLRKAKDSFFVALLSRWAEGFLVKKSDLALAVSPVDAESFERLYGLRPEILPNGTDLTLFERINREKVAKIQARYGLRSPVVLFMGLIGFKPNNEALEFLNGGVFPKLQARIPGIRLAVIGGKAPSPARWMLNPGSIPFEDVGPFIMACDVCVAPIFSGSGTRLKILEYLSARKPVISTAKGAEGLRLKDGRDFILAETSDEFVEAVVRLIKNPALASRLGSQGYDTVARYYSWPSIIVELNSELRRLI